MINLGQKPWDYFACDPARPDTWPNVPKDLPRFDMLKCPDEAKNVVKNRYPPDRKSGQKPRICVESDKKDRGSEISEGLKELGRSNERGLIAIAESKTKQKGNASDPIEISDTIYTFTFSRDMYKTTYATECGSQKMEVLMKEAQKDRGSGGFNLSKEDVRKLGPKEIQLTFTPTNETVKLKNLSYSLPSFNNMSVAQFSRSVKDTDISIKIELELTYRSSSNKNSPYKIWD